MVNALVPHKNVVSVLWLPAAGKCLDRCWVSPAVCHSWQLGFMAVHRGRGPVPPATRSSFGASAEVTAPTQRLCPCLAFIRSETPACSEQQREWGNFHPEVSSGNFVSCLLLGGWCSSRRRRPSLPFSKQKPHSPAAERALDSRSYLPPAPIALYWGPLKSSSRPSEEIQTRAKKGLRGHRYPCHCAVDKRLSTYQKIEFHRR